MTIDTTRLRALAEKATPGPWDGEYKYGIMTADRSRNIVSWDYAWGDSANECDDKPFIAACSPDVILALLDEVERLRALVAALEPSPMPASADDTRDWYWREDDNETTPNGPYATREAALADVPGYYAVGEMPERVLVGRCTDPLSLVTLDAEDVREMLRDRLMGICDMDVSIHDQPRADDALDAWIREHVVCEWEWVTDPKEEWVDVAEPTPSPSTPRCRHD